jgi:hypothetical protein
MDERTDIHGARVSRRDLGKAIAGAVAGAVMTAASLGSEEAASAQTTEQEPTMDSRLTAIEKTLGRTLTEEQRKVVLTNIKNSEEAAVKSRQFRVPDGTEPRFLFRPAPLRTPRPTRNTQRSDSRLTTHDSQRALEESLA